MYSLVDVRLEAQEALEKLWFVQSVHEIERTAQTLSLRFYIRPDLFVHVFLGELTGSLYLALIEGERRIFGVDRVAGEWHLHPYEAPYQHELLSEDMEPKPLLTFLSMVEDLLLQHDLL